MKTTDIIDYQREQPFRPFRLFVSDGTIYDIRHPELVKVNVSRAEVYVPINDEPFAPFERRISIALEHVVRIEHIQPQEPSAAGQT
jgi:hypothetical protein